MLVYDTRCQPANGVRAAAQSARTLLFAVDDAEILLRIAPGGQSEHVRLFGQILEAGDPVEDAAVSLCGPRAILDQATDEDGEFQFSRLPRGHYGLDVMTATRVIRVDALDVD
jgi:hypothetical protein